MVLKRYTAEEKEQALELADKVGAQKAAQELNISYGSMLAWRKKEQPSEILEDKTDLTQAVAEVSSELSSNKPTVGSCDLPVDLKLQLLEQEVAFLKIENSKLKQAIQALAQ